MDKKMQQEFEDAMKQMLEEEKSPSEATSQNDQPEDFRSGVVAVVGRPNVGKSSLINAILKYKLSIVTAKPQTTRDNILALYNSDHSQIVFVDTPGIHKPVHKLGQRLVDRAVSTLQDADLVVFVITIDDKTNRNENYRILEILKTIKTPVLLAINKVDLKGSKEKIMPLIEAFKDQMPFVDILPISAMSGSNLDKLLSIIESKLPVGHPLYPDDMITDRTERFIAQEVIREKIILETEQEVPHSVAIEIEEYKSPDEYPDRKTLYVRATIYVEREGQKAIIMGPKGEKIKAIGKASRIALEEITGHKTFIELWVKVKKGWRDSEKELKRLGYGA